MNCSGNKVANYVEGVQLQNEINTTKKRGFHVKCKFHRICFRRYSHRYVLSETLSQIWAFDRVIALPRFLSYNHLVAILDHGRIRVLLRFFSLEPRRKTTLLAAALF